MEEVNKSTNTTNSEYLTRPQIAERYNLSQRIITKMQKSGKLPSITLNRRVVRFPVTECDKVIQSLISNLITEKSIP